MLVCHVSQRPVGRVIATDLAETAEALDLATTGFVVFATLVDDPASVGDIVDAYLGEIMSEVVTADAIVDAGLLYAAAIVETTAADSVQDAAIPAPSVAARILCASRGGFGSAIVSNAIGKTQIIVGVGAVT
jgi:hypothetical protein